VEVIGDERGEVGADVERQRDLVVRRVERELGAADDEFARQVVDDVLPLPGPADDDADLRRIFAEGSAGHGTAAAFMRRKRQAIVGVVVRWTGQRKYVVDDLARKLIIRCAQLSLHAPNDEVALALDVGAYLASLVTNHLHTGRFKRSV
jgi:hypothetical protein